MLFSMSTNKKLYRSTKNKILGGVCGGLGEYFDIDPSLVRLLWLVVVFMGGSGVLIYIILWIILPEGENLSKEVKNDKEKSK
jgi:phage shock protein C